MRETLFAHAAAADVLLPLVADLAIVGEVVHLDVLGLHVAVRTVDLTVLGGLFARGALPLRVERVDVTLLLVTVDAEFVD